MGEPKEQQKRILEPSDTKPYIRMPRPVPKPGPKKKKAKESK